MTDQAKPGETCSGRVIVQCTRVKGLGWTPMRSRPNQTKPNHLSVLSQLIVADTAFMLPYQTENRFCQQLSDHWKQCDQCEHCLVWNGLKRSRMKGCSILVPAVFTSDSCPLTWQLSLLVTAVVKRDSCRPTWQLSPHVTAVITRDSCLCMWQLSSHVTAVVTRDSCLHSWQLSSHVTTVFTRESIEDLLWWRVRKG